MMNGVGGEDQGGMTETKACQWGDSQAFCPGLRFADVIFQRRQWETMAGSGQGEAGGNRGFKRLISAGIFFVEMVIDGKT